MRPLYGLCRFGKAAETASLPRVGGGSPLSVFLFTDVQARHMLHERVLFARQPGEVQHATQPARRRLLIPVFICLFRQLMHNTAGRREHCIVSSGCRRVSRLAPDTASRTAHRHQLKLTVSVHQSLAWWACQLLGYQPARTCCPAFVALAQTVLTCLTLCIYLFFCLPV